MGNIFSEDFRDFIFALTKEGVEYMLVGGLSVTVHGYGRTTGDMDIWVNQTSENYSRLVKAFFHFGMPVFDMSEDHFMSEEKDVFSFGRVPQKIEILTKVKGVSFSECYPNAELKNFEGMTLTLIGREDLIKAKEAVGRLKDKLDVEMLRKIWSKK